MPQPLGPLAHDVAELLSRFQRKIVFAESCTAGLISATLARVPGASNFHCGSAVVYRLDTKTRWLGVSRTTLHDHGAVSEAIAIEMALGALAHTPEADLAAAITGHLGPNAPDHQDGLIYIAIAVRNKPCQVNEYRLPKIDVTGAPLGFPGESEREQRQWAAVELVFTQIISTIRAGDYCG